MKMDWLDINNESNGYLDEKELFILFSLFRNRHISTMWSNVFVRNKRAVHIFPDDEDQLNALEKEIRETLKRQQSQNQSSVVWSYLLELGKKIDEKGFSISCDTDYSLLEGGFLCADDVGTTMYEYLADTEQNRKESATYNVLNKEQRAFLDEAIKKSKLDQVQLSKLAITPIKEYREAILNKNADKDFIVLVNKLTAKDSGSTWNTADATKFLEIFFRHNREEFSKNAMSEKTLLYEDNQTKLAHLIFAHADVHLNIKDTRKVYEYLVHYLTLFREDRLNGQSGYGLTRHFFSTSSITPLHTKLFGFKKQREVLLKHIEDTYEKYKRDDLEIGNPYIEPEYIDDREEGSVKVAVSKINDETGLFLFVHTMLALAYDKYLRIEDFSYGPVGILDEYDRGFLFKIRLKNNTKDISEQKLFEGYDEKYCLLRFAGQEIALAKKGKETDAVLLMKTLLKAKNAEWRHNDEILEDWGYNDEDQKRTPKNKVYFAGQKINNAVALKTQIDDFIECNTSKARVNPKYRRVDE